MSELWKYTNSKKQGKIIFDGHDINWYRDRFDIFSLQVMVFIYILWCYCYLFNCLEYVGPGTLVQAMQNISVL